MDGINDDMQHHVMTCICIRELTCCSEGDCATGCLSDACGRGEALSERCRSWQSPIFLPIWHASLASYTHWQRLSTSDAFTHRYCFPYMAVVVPSEGLTFLSQKSRRATSGKRLHSGVRGILSLKASNSLWRCGVMNTKLHAMCRGGWSL